MLKSRIKKEIEAKINELQMYLENNYKDLAIEAQKEAITWVEESHKSGGINDKTYEKYKKVLNEYAQKMKNYNHQQFYKS